MNSKITKSALILSLVGLSSALFAQETLSDTTGRFQKNNFVHGLLDLMAVC